MTSLFAQSRILSHRLFLEYHHFCHTPQTTRGRVTFFCNYLREVVPLGLIVHYIAVSPDDRWFELDGREEILLMTDAGKIFMSGLVSQERSHLNLERAAGDEAYTNWHKGEFTADGNSWRFFTGHSQTIRFFSSRNTSLWGAEGEFNMMDDAEDVAAFLQEEYDRLLWRDRHR